MPTHPPQVVTTERLHLIPIGHDHAEALPHGAEALAARLGVAALAGAAWPPEMLVEHLSSLAEATKAGGEEERGWWCWAIVLHAEAVDRDEIDDSWILQPLSEGPRLIGLALFLGPPIQNAEADDSLETSLTIAFVDDMAGYGLGTEALRSLTAWAFHPDRGEQRPDRLLVDVLVSMEAAKHMLRKCGFRRLAAGPEPGSELFALERT